MKLLASAAFAGLLLLGAVGLVVWHVRAWRSQRGRKLEPEEREFFRRQFRRRVQTSTLLAVIAVSLPFGQWIIEMAGELPEADWPKRTFAGWLIVLVLLLAWVAVLAVADLWSSRLFFGRLRQRHFLEKTRLEAELRRARAAEAEAHRADASGGNGKPSGNGTGGGGLGAGNGGREP